MDLDLLSMPFIELNEYGSNKNYRSRIGDSVLYQAHNSPFQRNHRYHDRISQDLNNDILEMIMQ